MFKFRFHNNTFNFLYADCRF
ncbi:hypothetical protein GF407_07515 [candidate division KSB1 bacterium]|nr:hypothetical protein [candidate division KSB1 bacterium]